MLSKALLVVKSKAALAILGIVLVGGGGTAVAVTASGGQVPVLSTLVGGSSAHSTNKTPDTGNGGASHAHTVSMEGVLKSYDATGNTISVRGNGDTLDTTIDVNSSTTVNGADASTLTDLTKALGHKVQVQSTKQSDGILLAWKITVEAATGTPGSGQGQGQQTELQGTVMSVGATSFSIKLPDGSSKTVTVSAATLFAGRAHKLADLKVGDVVSVHGSTQNNSTVAADSVENH